MFLYIFLNKLEKNYSFNNNILKQILNLNSLNLKLKKLYTKQFFLILNPKLNSSANSIFANLTDCANSKNTNLTDRLLHLKILSMNKKLQATFKSAKK